MSVAPHPLTFNHKLTFSRDRFNKYDPYAKEVASELLTQMGYKVVFDAEAYGSHDFLATLGDKEFKVEVEQKNGWEFRQFPFRTHRVSHRKHTSRADLFLQVSKNGKYVAMCPMKSVLTSPVVLRDTCFGTKDEPFFDVPTSAMTYYDYEGGTWYESD
jgi:hypothetical protein